LIPHPKGGEFIAFGDESCGLIPHPKGGEFPPLRGGAAVLVNLVERCVSNWSDEPRVSLRPRRSVSPTAKSSAVSGRPGASAELAELRDAARKPVKSLVTQPLPSGMTSKDAAKGRPMRGVVLILRRHRDDVAAHHLRVVAETVSTPSWTTAGIRHARASRTRSGWW
jgi:hypothetical protein